MEPLSLDVTPMGGRAEKPQSYTARVLLFDDGTGTLTVDGATQRVDAVDVATARDELSDRLRHHAQRTRGAVRAHLTDPTGAWVLQIDATGAITTIPDIGGDQEPDLAAELFGRPGASGNVSRPRGGRSLAPDRRTVLLAAGLTLAVGCTAAGTWWIQREREPSAVSVQPVEGWTRQISWQSPPLAPTIHGSTPVLPLSGAFIAAIDTGDGGSLAAIDTSTGATLWAMPLDEPLTGPPQTIGPGQKAVAATTAHTLTIWTDPNEATATSQTWTFTEADVLPVTDSPIPLLANPRTATAITVQDGELLRRTLPRDAQPFAADSHGRVLAATSDGHWWSLTDDTGSPHMLQPPAYGARVRTILGVSGQTLVVSWTRDTANSILAGYAIEDGMDLSWEAEVSGKPAKAKFSVAPDGTWFIVDTTAVDAQTGQTRSLPEDWLTLSISNEVAWSQDHVAEKLKSARTLDRPVADPDGVPFAITADGLGLIVADNGSTTRVYALEPDPKEGAR